MSKQHEHREYGEILTAMLLCDHFNPESDKALRKCLTLVKRRLMNPNMRALCFALIKARRLTPLNWLRKTIGELEEHSTITLFLAYARTNDERLLSL